MMINRSIVISMLILEILLSRCSNPLLQPGEFADSIELSYEKGPRVGTNQYLTVWLMNQSTACFIFPPDFGLKLFTETNDGWSEVPNLVSYTGDQANQLKPKGEVFSERSIDLRPDLSGLSITKPTNFYGLVSGQLCDDASVAIEKKIPFVVTP